MSYFLDKRNPVVQTVLGRYDFFRFQGCYLWGLSCAFCPDNNNWSPIESHRYDDGNRNREVHFCPSCQAIICHSCASGVQQVSCRWCGNHVSGITIMYFSPEDQDSEFLQRYARANENIRENFGLWQKCMERTYPGFDFEKICWKNMVISDGWKFFIDFNSFLTEQLPNQFGILISMMMKNAFAGLYYPQPVLHPSCSRFLQMPAGKQIVYLQPRNFYHMHSLSLFLTSAMTTKQHRNNLLTLRRYLLSNYAKRLLHTFGICRMVYEPDPWAFDPNRESDRFLRHN